MLQQFCVTIDCNTRGSQDRSPAPQVCVTKACNTNSRSWRQQRRGECVTKACNTNFLQLRSDLRSAAEKLCCKHLDSREGLRYTGSIERNKINFLSALGSLEYKVIRPGGYFYTQSNEKL